MTKGLANRIARASLFTVLVGCSSFSQESCASAPVAEIELTEKQILDRVISRVQPNIPAGFGRIDGVVIVQAIIGTEGKVRCAKVIEPAHPLLGRRCEEALTQWRFRPMKKKGRLVVFAGPVRFHIKR